MFRVILLILFNISTAIACTDEITSTVRGYKELGIEVQNYEDKITYYDENGILAAAIIASHCSQTIFNSATEVNCGPKVATFIEKAVKRAKEYLKELDGNLQKADLSSEDKAKNLEQYKNILNSLEILNKLVHQQTISKAEFKKWGRDFNYYMQNQSFRTTRVSQDPTLDPTTTKQNENTNTPISKILDKLNLMYIYNGDSAKCGFLIDQKAIDQILNSDWTEVTKENLSKSTKSEGAK